MKIMKNKYEKKVKSQKKTCPPGKVVNPSIAGRCVIDRSLDTSAEPKTKHSIVFKRKAKKNLNCVIRFEKKYQERPSPPYPAVECPLEQLQQEMMVYLIRLLSSIPNQVYQIGG